MTWHGNCSFKGGGLLLHYGQLKKTTLEQCQREPWPGTRTRDVTEYAGLRSCEQSSNLFINRTRVKGVAIDLLYKSTSEAEGLANSSLWSHKQVRKASTSLVENMQLRSELRESALTLGSLFKAYMHPEHHVAKPPTHRSLFLVTLKNIFTSYTWSEENQRLARFSCVKCMVDKN